MPGSAIVKELERLTEQKFHKGTIFPLLYEMEKKGFLKSAKTCKGLSNTKNYEITESGLKLLDHLRSVMKMPVKEVMEDLIFFGRESRPMYKSISVTTEPYLPGLSGEDDAVISLLVKAGIALKEDDRWRTIGDLTVEEKQNIFAAVMQKLISDGQGRLNVASANLVAAHNQQEMAFRDLIQKHKEAQGQAMERANWERRRNDLLARKRRQ
jgi:DNA-binding PadR family transcriptional regulator